MASTKKLQEFSSAFDGWEIGFRIPEDKKGKKREDKIVLYIRFREDMGKEIWEKAQNTLKNGSTEQKQPIEESDSKEEFKEDSTFSKLKKSPIAESIKNKVQVEAKSFGNMGKSLVGAITKEQKKKPLINITSNKELFGFH